MKKESVEHLVTVIGAFLEKPTGNIESDTFNYNRAVTYVKEWIKYRMPIIK